MNEKQKNNVGTHEKKENMLQKKHAKTHDFRTLKK